MGRPRKTYVEEVSDEVLKRTAAIFGCSSAAAQALAERDRRRADGEDAVVLWDHDVGMLLVGPLPKAPT